MALSTWSVAARLSIDEVASMLSQVADHEFEVGRVKSPGLARMTAWRRTLVSAAQSGEITPSSVHLLSQHGKCFGIEDAAWRETDIHDVEATFERQEVFRWLKMKGIPDSHIPEELKWAGETVEHDASLPKAAAEELRALEALGLLAETFAKLGPKYRKGDAGKPNCAQIAQAMSQQAGDTPGMGERKLAGLLSDALDAWRDKRR